jgi:hypothetical protein
LSRFKSEKSITDENLLKVIASSLKPSSKKKNKKKSKAAANGDEAATANDAE